MKKKDEAQARGATVASLAVQLAQLRKGEPNDFLLEAMELLRQAEENVSSDYLEARRTPFDELLSEKAAESGEYRQLGRITTERGLKDKINDVFANFRSDSAFRRPGEIIKSRWLNSFERGALELACHAKDRDLDVFRRKEEPSKPIKRKRSIADHL